MKTSALVSIIIFDLNLTTVIIFFDVEWRFYSSLLSFLGLISSRLIDWLIDLRTLLSEL